MPRKKLKLESVSEPVTVVESGEEAKKDKGILGRFYAELEARVQLFKDGETFFGGVQDGEAFKVWRLDSKEATRFLQEVFYTQTRRPLNQTTLSDAKAMLEMRAAKEGKSCKVGLRFLRRAGGVYLDLCNEAYQVLHITGTGWQVIQPQEPFFYRRGEMQALPLPQNGGDWGEFWSFLNIPKDSHRLLVRAWLVTALMAEMNVPLLVLSGEQGSAKSSASRILRQLIDPHKHLLHNMPASEHELFVSAQGHAVLAFDNMSRVNAAMSNALCKLITGSSYVTRKLYQDSEEVCLEAKRPIIINGIDDLVEKQDLISRTVMVHLPPIPEANMQTEMVFYKRLEAARPQMLGLILVDVQVVLNLLPLMPEAGFSSRMADYTRVGMALAEGIGLGQAAFEEAFQENRLFATETGLMAEPVAEALLLYLKRYTQYEGSASDLLKLLGGAADEYMKLSQRWPKQPNYLVQTLNQINPALRQRGIVVEFTRTSEKRWVKITKQDLVKNTVTTVTNRSEQLNQAVSNGQLHDGKALSQPLPSPIPTVQSQRFERYDGDDGNRSKII